MRDVLSPPELPVFEQVDGVIDLLGGELLNDPDDVTIVDARVIPEELHLLHDWDDVTIVDARVTTLLHEWDS